MDDREVDLSHLLQLNPDMSASFDEFLRTTRTCTHTHTCNPPGPSATTHTHTCYHTHTQVLPTDEGDGEPKNSRKPLGNREAVRKYREKKKAHTAHLEEEVKQLRVLNQQLLERLQGQASLETEVVRLRSLLVDLRAKIDGELGVTLYPFQKQCGGASLQCNKDTQCLGGDSEMVGWEENCVPATMGCQINSNGNIGQNLGVVEAIRVMDVVGAWTHPIPMPSE